MYYINMKTNNGNKVFIFILHKNLFKNIFLVHPFIQYYFKLLVVHFHFSILLISRTYIDFDLWDKKGRKFPSMHNVEQ